VSASFLAVGWGGRVPYHPRDPLALEGLLATFNSILLPAEDAKERLREIVEGFFFRRLKAKDGKRIGRLLVKSPPGLGKTRAAVQWAIAYQVG